MLAVKRKVQSDSEKPIKVGGADFTPAQITGHYVQVLKRAAEIELGLDERTIKRAVVTIPAAFGDKAQAHDARCVQNVRRARGSRVRR